MESRFSVEFKDGTAIVYDSENMEYLETHSFEDYLDDLQFILKLMAFGPAKTFCHERLNILQCRFKLHLLYNNEVEHSRSAAFKANFLR